MTVGQVPGAEGVEGVQYGAEVASVYDSLIAAALPVESTVELLRDAVAGKDVLEIGVGTGRVAVPVAPLTRSFTGIDNSPDMLAVLRGKETAWDRIDLVEADFRDPIPTERDFDIAYSTLGSLACVGSRTELVTALRNVFDRLRPGGSLWVEYYARDVYLGLVQAGEISVKDIQGRDVTYTTTLSPVTDVLTMRTRLSEATGVVEFDESVLLLDVPDVEACFTASGFVDVRCSSGGGMPYDLYIATKG